MKKKGKPKRDAPQDECSQVKQRGDGVEEEEEDEEELAAGRAMYCNKVRKTKKSKRGCPSPSRVINLRDNSGPRREGGYEQVPPRCIGSPPLHSKQNHPPTNSALHPSVFSSCMYVLLSTLHLHPHPSNPANGSHVSRIPEGLEQAHKDKCDRGADKRLAGTNRHLPAGPRRSTGLEIAERDTHFWSSPPV
ncbi:unnamed protein product [Pleuronectes platessa]|uniref:Uncharacterized protein n=1 Tax=Pleuronectes platessa TaxID=8262 RepID=A0A9N7Z6P9_PLEPL|nr:unnamed protein product [Pleuronectes platessa]